MDRGLMDSAGYMSKESWELLKQMTGWSNVELRDERYDAILHMITAADGAPQFYDHENVARYENVQEAIIRDQALRDAYLGHNQIFVVGNNQSFEDKIQ